MSRVVIFGTGDFARIAHVYLREDSPHEVVAFTVDERYVDARRAAGPAGGPVRAARASDYPPASCAMFVAIGFSRVNKARAEVYERCKAHGYELITYVSSRAIVLGETRDRRQLLRLRGERDPAVRADRQRRRCSGAATTSVTTSTIGDHCFIASHAVVSGNVTIGALLLRRRQRDVPRRRDRRAPSA